MSYIVTLEGELNFSDLYEYAKTFDKALDIVESIQSDQARCRELCPSGSWVQPISIIRI